MSIKPTNEAKVLDNIATRISSNRSAAMGIAIVSVMLFHLFPHTFPYLGHWGVDIFIFVSGFGIFYSLSKTNSLNYWHFYKKRILRVMPTACLAGSIIGIVNYFFSNIAYSKLGLPHGFDYLIWGCGLRMWYIRTILLLYFVSPFLFFLVWRKHIVPVILSITLISLFGFSLTLEQSHHVKPLWCGLYLSIPLTLAELSAFFAGMWIARMGDSYKIKLPSCILSSLIFLLLMFFCKTFLAPRWPFFAHIERSAEVIFLLPSISLFCSTLNILIKHLPSCIEDSCIWLGKHSLEVYLVHEATFNIFLRTLGMRYSHTIVIPIAVLISFILAYLLKLSASKITNLFFKQTSHRNIPLQP